MRLHIALSLGLCCLFGLAACAGNSAAPSPQPGKALSQPAGFRLSVLPETYQQGGKLAALSLQQHAAGDELRLDIVATDASALKALFFTLDYDAQQLTPLAADSGNALGPAGQCLQLSLSTQPGRLEYGELRIHPQAASGGFSGTGTLATLRFARRPFSAARQASRPPQTDGSKFALSYDAPSGVLSWPYHFEGDYNQDFRVSVQDLSPIGIYFGATVPADPNSIGAVVDGNSDGVISVQDLSAIGINYPARIDGYNIYEAADESAYPATNIAPSALAVKAVAPSSGAGAFGVSGDPAAARLQLDRNITPESPVPSSIYWLRPYDASGEGTPSLVSGGGGAGNTAPVINDVIINPDPVSSGGMALILVNASDADSDFLSFSFTPSFGTVFGGDAPGQYYFEPGEVLADTTMTFDISADDGHGGIDTYGGHLEVLAPQAGNDPVTFFNISADAIPIPWGGACNFALNYTDPDGDSTISTWRAWDTGGGNYGHFTNLVGDSTTFLANTLEADQTQWIIYCVDDQHGHAYYAQLVFTVEGNAAPELSGISVTDPVFENSTVPLSANVTDPDLDFLTYAWTCSEGLIDDPGGASPNYTAPPGDADFPVTIAVTVEDGHGHSVFIDRVITIDGEP